MKAHQFESAASGLRLLDLPDPTAGEGQVLIRVEAAGMCQSDVHIINGHGDAWLRQRPIVLGHEVAGTVMQLGPGVSEVAVGDRVAVALISHPASEADFADGIGLGFDGGYAEFAAVPVRNLVPVPDGVPFTHAAVATDSIATAYHAVATEAAISEGSVVAVIGLGGLGLNAVRIASLLGATVHGIDIDPGTFAAAAEQGAYRCHAGIDDIEGEIDIVLDFAGVGTSTADAISAVRQGGRIVLVGLGVQEATLPTGLLITKNIQLRGSLGASVEELQAVLGLLADGTLEPVVEEVDFRDLESALRRLERGDVRGRLVTRPNAYR
ncbi:Zn-dependent alcohol dehydrogenase [Gordonia terrae]|uniref:Zn-dependent alcohol dehydrogenase n=3 Tax=Gordonia terrae TaxID=2055 RepID=A0AAD0NYF5_9ACTN|nr:zinc-binding dehydrogenase [Gordonia terrae]VTR09554.1 alcohol dehydrogenase GroES domain-containing protein [Clostridioides difficile]ANY22172.1 Zn-dependent alcohol dehydrogenase [Gordonia terrae]AWO82914.1 Zn-dependent alcohol dehydrogenase [Gordonia terrae]VTS28998.1 Alcohol dehydrogenase [Gordonia terrae]GAB46368.1 putative oxidoreductase [Gordonia terrae NBRC 100016]